MAALELPQIPQVLTYSAYHPMPPPRSSLLGRLALHLVFNPLHRWQEQRLPGEDVVVDTCGMKMKVFPPRTNRVGRALFKQGVWEPEVTGAFRALVKPGDTVFDIGGDAGYYTLLFAKSAGAKGKVIVFEPIPKAQERIMENVRMNGFTNVELIGLALGTKAGSFILEKPFEDSRINMGKTEPEEGDIKVEVERYDVLAQARSLPVPDLVKIDVEGAEYEILQGMEQLVNLHHPTFVIELHPHFLPQFGAKVSDVTDWLTQRGYHLTAIDAGDISPTEATTILAQALK